MTQDLYPKIINTIARACRRCVYHAAVLRRWISPIRNWSRSSARHSVRAALAPEAKVKFLKAAWDAVGSEFGSRHTQYEMFYAGAQFVTAGHSFRTYGWDGSAKLLDRLMSSFTLADTLNSVKH